MKEEIITMWWECEVRFRMFRRRWFEFYEGMGEPYIAELCINFDQVKLFMDLVPNMALFRRGEKQSGRFTNSDRSRFTGCFTFNAAGEKMPVMYLFRELTGPESKRVEDAIG